MTAGRAEPNAADWRPHGNEASPDAAGVDAAGLATALGEVAGRGGSWQLVVWRGDQLVIDRRSDAAGPDLFWLWSASKPYIALLVWQLAERGVLSVDDPLARWWPEFGARGKQDVTIRQVLQHRSGLPTGPGGRTWDIVTMADWRWSVHRLAMARPRWAAGERTAYHYLSYGFLLGEVVRRATGRELPELMAEQIWRPLGLSDTFLGLPDAELGRAVPVSVTDQVGGMTDRVLNSRRVRRAVIPAGGVSSTAADLARFYRAMLNGGELDGVRVASAQTIEQMCLQSSDEGVPDGLLHYALRFGQGFQLGGQSTGWPRVEPFGRLSTARTFGHNGSNACTGWADPDSGLAVAYLANRVRGWNQDRLLMWRLADALLAACR